MRPTSVNFMTSANTASTSSNPRSFPAGFTWGTATAAHQVEGNNWNNDWWEWEHRVGTSVKEPSGDTCDHYNLYPQDIAMLAKLGFDNYDSVLNGVASSQRTESSLRQKSITTEKFWKHATNTTSHLLLRCITSLLRVGSQHRVVG